jgi:DNA-binding MarR family transcriptional regulator
MIDRLEEAGKVERRRDPDDRRAWRIYLTDKARPIIDQLHRIGDEMIEEALTGIDDVQRTALSDSLNIMRTNLQPVTSPSQNKDEAASG